MATRTDLASREDVLERLEHDHATAKAKTKGDPAFRPAIWYWEGWVQANARAQQAVRLNHVSDALDILFVAVMDHEEDMRKFDPTEGSGIKARFTNTAVSRSMTMLGYWQGLHKATEAFR